jgi:hypothetical protein
MRYLQSRDSVRRSDAGRNGHRQSRDLFRNTRGLLAVAAHTSESWLHFNRGEENALRRTLLGFGLMLIYMIVYHLAFPRVYMFPMGLFTLWTTLLSTVHWLGTLWRRITKKPLQHSRYTGEPHLLRWLRCDEMTIKWMEPPCLFALGLLVRPHSPPVGIWIMLSGLSMLILMVRAARIERKQVVDLNNSVIEQTVRAQKFGRMRQ